MSTDETTWLDGLRVQAAAVAAQQAALVEQELRLRERETVLSRQEAEIAAHLEEKQQLALELQEQIAEARAKLRQKRAAHEALATQQAQELDRARAEAADLLGAARAERDHMATLARRLRERWKKRIVAEKQRMLAVRAMLADERAVFEEEVEQQQAELRQTQKQIQAQRQQLHAQLEQLDSERSQWRSVQCTEETQRRLKLRDLARRTKAMTAEESQHRRLIDELKSTARERRKEIDQLETRIVNLRQKLIDQQGQLLQTVPAATSLPVSEPTEDEARRTELLARIADDLADQRLMLAEQAARLALAQDAWLKMRADARDDLDRAAADLQAEVQELTRRSRELGAMESQVQAETANLTMQRMKLDAERLAEQAKFSSRNTEQKRRAEILLLREQRLDGRAKSWADLWRTWGIRRTAEIARLREAREASWAERAEWAAARAVWLRASEKLEQEHRELTARAGAIEQLRRETLDQAENPAAAERRLERLQRRWENFCDQSAKDLERLRATLTSEAARLDEEASRQHDLERGIDSRQARVENLVAQHERKQLQLRDDAARVQERIAAAQSRADLAEQRAEQLRAQVETLAKLVTEREAIEWNRAA